MSISQFQETIDPSETYGPTYRKWATLGSLLLLIAILLRSWATLSQQAFYVEDASLFNRYYDNALPLSSVGDHLLGQPYITLITKFFAWLFAYADVRLHALLYQWTGFIFGMFAAIILFFTGLIRSRTVLLLGPLLMGLTAMNHIYYYNTLIYIMYSGIAILLALLFYPIPKRAISRFLLLIIVIILPWAGPYSVVAVPTVLALLLFYPGKNFKSLLLLAVLVSTLFYYLTVEGNTTMLANLKKWVVIRHFFDALLVHIIFMGQFKHISHWFWIPVLLTIFLSLYLLRHDTSYIKNSLIFFGIIIASLALFFLSSKFSWYTNTKACHRLLSIYFWCFYLLYTLDSLFVRYGSHRFFIGAFAVMLGIIIIHDNIRYPGKHRVEPVPETSEFLNEVYRFEQMGLKPRNEQVFLRLDNHRTAFVPQVVVGSRAGDAIRLYRADLPAEYQSPFLADEN